MADNSGEKWHPFENGDTLGKTGSECAIIIWDEEHSDGVRLTLDANGHVAPFSVTMNIYGWISYSVFFDTLEEVRDTLQSMKPDVENLLALTKQDMPDDIKKPKYEQAVKEFIAKYPSRAGI